MAEAFTPGPGSVETEKHGRGSLALLSWFPCQLDLCLTQPGQVSLQPDGPCLTFLPVALAAARNGDPPLCTSGIFLFNSYQECAPTRGWKTAETIPPLYKFHTSDQKGPEGQLRKESIFTSSPFPCHLCPHPAPPPHSHHPLEKQDAVA